jgi:F-box and WD-40 domain protein CDC4
MCSRVIRYKVSKVCKRLMAVYSIIFDTYRNRCVSGSMDNTAKVWDIATGDCLRTLTGHTSLVGLLGITSNHLVSAASDSRTHVWDANTYELQHLLSFDGHAVSGIHHDRTRLVVGSGGTLRLFDIKEGTTVCDLIEGASAIWTVAGNGDKIATAYKRNGLTEISIYSFQPDV